MPGPTSGANPVKGSSGPSPIREDLHQANLEGPVLAPNQDALTSNLGQAFRRRMESYVILPLYFLHFTFLD